MYLTQTNLLGRRTVGEKGILKVPAERVLYKFHTWKKKMKMVNQYFCQMCLWEKRWWPQVCLRITNPTMKQHESAPLDLQTSMTDRRFLKSGAGVVRAKCETNKTHPCKTPLHAVSSESFLSTRSKIQSFLQICILNMYICIICLFFGSELHYTVSIGQLLRNSRWWLFFSRGRALH